MITTEIHAKAYSFEKNTFDPSLRPGALRYPPDPRDGRDGRDPRDRRDLTEANQFMN